MIEANGRPFTADGLPIEAFRHGDDLVTVNNRSLTTLIMAGQRPTNISIVSPSSKLLPESEKLRSSGVSCPGRALQSRRHQVIGRSWRSSTSRRLALGGHMYRIPFDGLRTTFAEFPQVSLDAVAERSHVTMRFAVSPTVDGRWDRATVTFDRVLDFHFYDFEIGLPYPDGDELEFGLIECMESQLVSSFVSFGVLSRMARPIVSPGDLRHLRIAFDEHGVYDIVCLDVSCTIGEGQGVI